MITLDILFLVSAFAFGLIVGSFINAAEYRVFHKLPLGFSGGSAARSSCVHCEYQLGFFDLLPVASYVILRGKCRSCKESISSQYPIVELVTAFVFLLIAWVVGWSALTVFYSLFAAVLVFLFVYDLKHMLILDVVTIPSIAAVLAVHFLLGSEMLPLLIGGLVGGGFFALQYIVSKGRWIGGGDIRLGALIGVMVGWELTLLALFLTYVGGSIISLTLLALKKVTMKSQIPFGVFLAPAGFVALLFGEGLLDWYLNLFL